MYEIKKQIYLNLTKKPEVRIVQLPAGSGKKSMDLSVEEIWGKFCCRRKVLS